MIRLLNLRFDVICEDGIEMLNGGRVVHHVVRNENVGLAVDVGETMLITFSLEIICFIEAEMVDIIYPKIGTDKVQCVPDFSEIF